jgi:hypothetical protein
MAVRVGHVGSAAASVAEVLEMGLMARSLQVLDEGVEVGVLDVQSEVDMTAAALGGERLDAGEPKAMRVRSPAITQTASCQRSTTGSPSSPA